MPVEAHSGRCFLAPLASRAAQRGSLANSIEQLVSRASVGHSGLALESLGFVGAVGFQQLVHSGVHAGDEEGSDGADVLQVVAVGVAWAMPSM